MEIGQAIRRVGGKPRAMRGIVEAFRRPPTVRLPDLHRARLKVTETSDEQ